MPPHRLDECADGRWLDGRGDVHVGAEARASPNDRGLRAEQVPRLAPFRHHGGQGAEKLSDRAAALTRPSISETRIWEARSVRRSSSEGQSSRRALT